MAFTNPDDFQDMDNQDQEIENEAPEESNNRTFLIVAGILGAIIILSMLCIAFIAFQQLGPSRSLRQTQAAEVLAQNTAMALSVQQTDEASKITPTATATERPTATVLPTNTPVLARPAAASATALAATAAASGGKVSPTINPHTATVAALLTQAANAQKTIIPTSTLLPDTGFADEVGLPTLVIMAVILVVVIFLARRLRSN